MIAAAGLLCLVPAGAQKAIGSGGEYVKSLLGFGAGDFAGRELLGRPTDRSVTARVVPARPLELYAEWGAGTAGTYGRTTPPVAADASAAIDLVMDGLARDQDYSYRLRWRRPGAASFEAGPNRTFHTQRMPASTFTFDIQADPHLDDNSSASVYTQALANERNDRPDFLVDLGDTPMSDKCSITNASWCGSPAQSASAVWSREALQRGFFDQVGHSVPVFLVLGNHDGETGWLGTPSPNNLFGWSLLARKTFFANPEPDGFYTGSTDEVPGYGRRQNYYAFEWGNALFVMLDPFGYTARKPGQGGDGWSWTLGQTQYRWLAQTLAQSRARFKFVFSHHIVGGNGSEARGGAAFGRYFEWGGRNLDGSWAFDAQRPGWGVPIHQLLVDNHVNAWFHGHDHLYAMETLDGVVYQEVPQPSLSRYDTPNPAGDYGYQGTLGTDMFASSGHLRVTVSPTDAKVEYVRAVAPADETATRRNAAVLHSYVMR
ncbi:MAG: metallophosphoesterase [Vicinamibacterales bacterium]